MHTKFNLASGRTQDENLWNELSRAAYMATENTLDAHSYLDARFRVLMVLVALLLLLVVGLSPMYFGRATFPFEGIYDDLQYLFDYEGALRASFDRGETIYSNFEQLVADQNTVRGKGIRQSLNSLAFMLGLPVAPLVIALLSPCYAPVRIDIDRQIVYTWRRGEIWMKQLNGPDTRFSGELRAAPYGLNSRAANMDPWFGYTRVHLLRPDGSKTYVGASAYPPTRHNHNDDVLSLLWFFADDHCDQNVVRNNLRRTKFLPADILRALNKFSLRRVQSLDTPKVQAALEQALKQS